MVERTCRSPTYSRASSPCRRIDGYRSLHPSYVLRAEELPRYGANFGTEPQSASPSFDQARDEKAMTGKRVVFPGGTGKAGRHALPYLKSKGYELLNVDLKPFDHP